MKYDIRLIMKDAWKVAEAGALQFGGKPSDYFAHSLRLAWKGAKKQTMTGTERQVMYANDLIHNFMEIIFSAYDKAQELGKLEFVKAVNEVHVFLSLYSGPAAPIIERLKGLRTMKDVHDRRAISSILSMKEEK